jgi:hypothetical protein
MKEHKIYNWTNHHWQKAFRYLFLVIISNFTYFCCFKEARLSREAAEKKWELCERLIFIFLLILLRLFWHSEPAGIACIHRLNMELHLQSLFGLRPRNPLLPPIPRIWAPTYTRALLVSQDRRHRCVTPCQQLLYASILEKMENYGRLVALAGWNEMIIFTISRHLFPFLEKVVWRNIRKFPREYLWKSFCKKWENADFWAKEKMVKNFNQRLSLRNRLTWKWYG